MMTNENLPEEEQNTAAPRTNRTDEGKITESPKKKHAFRIGCFIFIFIMFILLGGMLLLTGTCMYFVMENPSGAPDNARISEIQTSGKSSAFNRGKLVRIDIRGVIMEGAASYGDSTDSEIVCTMLDKAGRDPEVKAVLVYLNTPGGEVTASDDIHQKIIEIRKIKPVVAYMSSMATSGGYYSAVACNRIVASRTTLTGSIGVIISTYNYKELFDKIGLSGEVYKSGEMKDMLNPARIRTPQEKAIVQELVSESYELFLKLVSEGRCIPIQKLRASGLCDGRVIHAPLALKAKLIDRIGRLKDAVSEAEKLANVEPCSLQLVRYTVKPAFWESLLSAKSAQSGRIQLELPGLGHKALPQGRLYYLPAVF